MSYFVTYHCVEDGSCLHYLKDYSLKGHEISFNLTFRRSDAQIFEFEPEVNFVIHLLNSIPSVTTKHYKNGDLHFEFKKHLVRKRKS